MVDFFYVIRKYVAIYRKYILDVMIEKLLLFSVRCWMFFRMFEYRECYGSDEQGRKLLHRQEPGQETLT